MVIYIAGPISNGAKDGPDKRRQRVEDARKIAEKLWTAGFAVICPHINNDFGDGCKLTWQQYLKGDLELVAKVDMVILLPGWENSRGAKKEKRFAKTRNIPTREYEKFLADFGLKDV